MPVPHAAHRIEVMLQPHGSHARFLRLALILVSGVLLGATAHLPVQATSQTTSTIPAGRRASNVALISIHGPIDAITRRSLERRLDLARNDGCDAVLLEIDTPGGDLLATMDILYLLRTTAPANTVAWIRPKAFSAGTIIALATREILVDPNGVFGDAAPVQGIPVAGLRQMAAAERAKVEAPLLSELVHEARRHGWDEKLVQAFVAVDAELWLIRNTTTGERLFVDANDFELLFGAAPPQTKLTRLPPAPARDATTGFLPGATMDTAPPPTPQERARDIEFVQDLPTQRPDMTTLDPANWELLGQVVSDDELLVVRAQEAEAYGLSSGTASTTGEIEQFFGGATITRYDETWSEHLVRFLTWWPVRGVLIVVMLVGFFFEMAAPGHGAFGAAAMAALGVLLVAPLLAGLAEWWMALVVVAGLALVALELFVIPGTGAIGIIGGLLLFAGLVGTFLGPDPLGSTTRSEVLRGLAVTGAGFFASGVIIWLLMRSLPGLPISRRIVLGAEVGGPGSDVVPPMPSTPDATAGIAVGDTGTAASDLRTAGRVEIQGKLLDGRSVGGYITRGTPVRVLAVDQFGVEVEAVHL